MSLFFVDGDFWEQPADIRINTVCCRPVMGAGLAKEFKQRFPGMFEAFKSHHPRKPGTMWIWQGGPPEIWNVATKDDWRDDSQYHWVRSAMLAIDDAIQRLPATSSKTLRITIPALGCGLGGLNWADIRDEMKHVFNLPTPHLIYCFAPR